MSGWFCQTCQEMVPPEHVTFTEQHDTRCGGCGDLVSPDRPEFHDDRPPQLLQDEGPL